MKNLAVTKENASNIMIYKENSPVISTLKNYYTLHFFMFILFLSCEGSTWADEPSSKKLDLSVVSMDVKLKEKSLLFVVKNTGGKDLLVADDFCFGSKTRVSLFEEPNMKERLDNFSNGTSRLQSRMALVKAHTERKCEIGYFENSQDNIGKKSNGVLFWHTNLFVGDLSGNYSGKKFMGVLPISFPVGELVNNVNVEIDETVLSAYKLRKELGVSE